MDTRRLRSSNHRAEIVGVFQFIADNHKRRFPFFACKIQNVLYGGIRVRRDKCRHALMVAARAHGVEPFAVHLFDDAAFVGDSRTDGFLLYSGIGCGENLTSNGLSIFKLAEKKALTIDGQKYTLLEALALKQYGKVYLSLGVNELGYNNDKGFYNAYCNAIDAIRACQPNAVIYIQGLIPLNEDVIAATGGASYLTNEHLRVYNDLMQQAAQEKQVVFLDLEPEFTGPDGQLPADASNDGVHLKKAYCQAWLEYLKTHTVSYETLYPTQEAQV